MNSDKVETDQLAVLYLDFAKAFDTVPPRHPDSETRKLWNSWKAALYNKIISD